MMSFRAALDSEGGGLTRWADENAELPKTGVNKTDRSVLRTLAARILIDQEAIPKRS